MPTPPATVGATGQSAGAHQSHGIIDGSRGAVRTLAIAVGIRRIMLAVEDLDDIIARIRTHGAELVGEIAQYEDNYRLCFLRGPEGFIVGLAEQLS